MQPETLAGRLRTSLTSSWRMKARPEQLSPAGDWAVWVVLAGRGWGKTRTGSEWVHEQVAMGTASRIALVAATAADARDVLIEGPSGILATAPKHARPEYEPSRRKLTWPNGAVAMTYSADEPERLRGPEHDAAWTDELAAWRYADAWDQLQLGLRMGRPRCVVTTTPKPVKLIRDLLAREGRDVVVTRGRTMDNRANLAPQFLESIEAKYGGTRLGRQELEGEFLQDTPGSLWQRDWIDRDRVEKAPELRRIVVAVDPATTNHEGSDATGIMVVGQGHDEHLYVLADLTGKYSPPEWARKAVEAYERYSADRIVGETNQGGQMVEHTIRAIDPSVPYKGVHASRGKTARAEPISALYEQRKVHHVGIGKASEPLLALEDQMLAFTSDFDRARAGYSPDRVDALVWAMTELAVKRQVPVAASMPFSGRRRWL